MKILVVDDGQLAINSLIRILCRVAPDCDYISAMTTEDALSWMRQGWTRLSSIWKCPA